MAARYCRARSVMRSPSVAASPKDLIAVGLGATLRQGYRASDFRADLVAALVTTALALPLALAFGLALGVPPQHGLYTAVLAGIACSLLGGSRFQVTGPTAAAVVALLPVVHDAGFGGVLVAGMLAGGILLLLGIARLGRGIMLVPPPALAGLAMGIAIALGVQVLPFVV